ncbi:hypothetical protein R3P38DRAFT_1362866 [Favolaschia claudopus]|uniref:Secreted protein n=1 Tax=Favolaschia claudopus TaxID=2862362 RepID=A0AAW0DUB4_9AGAR
MLRFAALYVLHTVSAFCMHTCCVTSAILRRGGSARPSTHLPGSARVTPRVYVPLNISPPVPLWCRASGLRSRERWTCILPRLRRIGNRSSTVQSIVPELEAPRLRKKGCEWKRKATSRCLSASCLLPYLHVPNPAYTFAFGQVSGIGLLVHSYFAVEDSTRGSFSMVGVAEALVSLYARSLPELSGYIVKCYWGAS